MVCFYSPDSRSSAAQRCVFVVSIPVSAANLNLRFVVVANSSELLPVSETCHWLPTLIKPNIYQPLCTFINPSQFLSTPHNFYQPLPIFINPP